MAATGIDTTPRGDRPPWFEQLNPAQRPAAGHGTGAGVPSAPLLVIAGAGSGKTLTLASRVAVLVQQGGDPQRLLLMTFSRRAAAAMERRVGQLLHEALALPRGTAPPRLPWCGTFHSVAARLLRQYAPSLGLAPQFTVLDRADAQELMGLVRQQQGLHQSARRFPLAATCLTLHSLALNTGSALRPLVERQFPWCEPWLDELQQLFAGYAAEKQRQQLLDYDDLLLYWQLMMGEPRLAERIRTRFDQVLVDEYQDTNALQQRILRALKPDGQGLTVVGDDAQAIYAFRGAAVRAILDFPATFDPPARIITLEQNYRSTPQILAAADAVMALAAERFPKILRSERRDAARPLLVMVEDEAAEAEWVADEALRQREQGLALRRQAVLFRSAAHSMALEFELARRGIPFVKYGGLRFLEAAHVKDLLSLLRWARNPRAQLAGLRVARLVPGIGPSAARAVVDAVAAADDAGAALAAWVPPARAGVEWAALRTTWLHLAQDGSAWPAAYDVALQWYLPHLQRLHADARVRAADLQQLRGIAEGAGGCDRFLAEIALDPPQSTSDEAAEPSLDEDYLVLSTIHSAKGQEWNAVSVLKVVDGCMPSDMATGSAAEIEEERRLLYVAMTRARDQLALLVPQRFHVTQQRALGDRHLYASLTRFIPPEVAGHFDVLRPVRAAIDDAADGGEVLLDVGAAARLRWSGSG